jgi:integration host factor subunit beta
MNKSELIERLAQKTELGQIQAEDVMNLIMDHMRRALADGKRIEIRGFGSFVVKEYKSYTGRNPKTGDKIWVGAKRLPHFKVGKELRERLNNNGGAKS